MDTRLTRDGEVRSVAEEIPLSPNELAEQRTDLAIRRTVMAADRSLMAWIRTGLSLISFGITIYKILHEAAKIIHERGEAFRDQSPRNIGLFLTGLGTIAIVIGTVEYWQTQKELHQTTKLLLWRPAFVVAMVMSAAGVFSFLSIIIRLL